MSNLAQRIVTAVVMIMLLLCLILKASTDVFAAALYTFGLLAVWELWRLVQAQQKKSLLIMFLVYSAVFMSLLIVHSLLILWVVGLLHSIVTIYLLRYKPKLQTLITGLYGAVLLAVVVYSVIVLQGLGWSVLISALIVVWSADIGGYFFGKALGGKFFKNRLAPHISPKKSWEGAIGGALLAVLLTMIIVLNTNLNVWLIGSGSNGTLNLNMLILTVLIAAYSVTGDLVESLLKRQAGVKDSSQLLPGHGGILDRIDALIPVLPLCAAWVISVGNAV